jgi:hypothetical protein
MRLDWVHADEPPDWDMWQELRFRVTANRLMPMFITFTPVHKKEWKPLREAYKGCGEPSGKDGKLEIRMSVYDNQALGKEHIKRLEQKSKGRLRDAKLLGDWVDEDGSCPFDDEGLKRWRKRCRPGEKLKFILLSGLQIEWERWKEADPNDEYLVVADPSSGIEDEEGDRDPAGVVVVGRRSRQVVARYNGYIIAGELGRFCVHLCRLYRNALLVWERNSGYGEAFFQGLKDPRLPGGMYGNIYIEHHLDTRGLSLYDKLGWYTTASTRGTIIAALQKAITTDGSLYVWSEDAVENLSNVVVRRDGLRIEAGAGSHDEDMIVLGLACHLLETYPLRTQLPGAREQLERNGVLPARESRDDSMEADDW